MIAAASSPENAALAIDGIAAAHSDDRRTEGLLFKPAVMAELAGQLFVRTIEVPEATRQLDATRATFLDLPFAEALEWFRARFPDDEDGLDDLLDAYRRRASERTRLLFEAVAKRARDRLIETLEEGGTLAEFASAVRSGAARLGIEAPTPGYLENVFRTQIQGAYGAGRQRQIETPAVMEARPFVELRTVQDNRVSDWCRPMDGKQWDIRDPAWKPHAPPRHYQCRSSVITLAPDEKSDAALAMSTVPPMPGFDRPPAEIS